MPTPQFDFEIEQGAYWTETFNWYGGGKQMAPIEDIVVGYPTKITVTAHGLPSVSATPVIVSGVEGIKDINSELLGIEQAIYLDADNFYMPVSSVADVWVPGTGEITWHAPSTTTGGTARMQIRKNWHSSTILHTLTTENGGIVITDADASFQLIILSAATTAFQFINAVYDLEFIDASGLVIRIAAGNIFLRREITQ
jgi:hypothetical protein